MLPTSGRNSFFSWDSFDIIQKKITQNHITHLLTQRIKQKKSKLIFNLNCLLKPKCGDIPLRDRTVQSLFVTTTP